MVGGQREQARDHDQSHDGGHGPPGIRGDGRGDVRARGNGQMNDQREVESLRGFDQAAKGASPAEQRERQREQIEAGARFRCQRSRNLENTADQPRCGGGEKDAGSETGFVGHEARYLRGGF